MSQENVSIFPVMQQVYRMAPIAQAMGNSLCQSLIVFDDCNAHD